jgi:25S rRNA (uracil2634-N3)-methyltransferase
VLWGVDARELGGRKEVRRAGPFDWVVFMFPHVGGKSADVNRQVRANQGLLVGFFRSANGLLRKAERDGAERQGDADGEEDGRPEGGSILVTLFEGEPYSLWNIRDLARASGLVVRRSWKFDASMFPRYSHARTAGVIMKGGVDGNEVSDTAWKGEERDARMYEFGLPEEKQQSHKKRKDGSSDDD